MVSSAISGTYARLCMLMHRSRSIVYPFRPRERCTRDGLRLDRTVLGAGDDLEIFTASPSHVGIALAAPIIVMSLFWQDALDEMTNVQFSAVDRSDVTVSFTNPVPGRAVHEIARLPGMLQVEAYRAYRSSYVPAPTLIALQSPACRPSPCAPVGRQPNARPPPAARRPLLSQLLARCVGLQLGDHVSVAVLEGRRPRVDIMVTGVVDEMLGIGAYAEIDTVHRLMGEADTISSVSIAASGGTSMLRWLLTDCPKAATISERTVSLRQFRETDGDGGRYRCSR